MYNSIKGGSGKLITVSTLPLGQRLAPCGSAVTWDAPATKAEFQSTERKITANTQDGEQGKQQKSQNQSDRRR